MRTRRDIRDAQRWCGALEMLDYIDSVSWIEHFNSEIARRVRVSAMHVTPALHFLLRVCNTTRRCRDSSTLNILFVNSVLHFTKLRALTSLGACTVARDSHMKSEF